MVFDYYSKKTKVFVSEVSDDMLSLRDNLIKVLNRAGMEVLYLNHNNIKNENDLIEENKLLINAADCSIHLLGNNQVGKNMSEGQVSVFEYQLKEAQKRINSEWRDFKIFIWYPGRFSDQQDENDDDNFISALRQGIVENMIFSNRDSVVSFVEDIRSVIFGGKPAEFDVDKTELFFIYNWIDQDYANEIISLVSDVIETRKLEIVISDDVDYSELVAQQIKKSKVVVIYFKNTADWALPFVQQVWKKVGGASSATPILLIGDGNVEENAQIKFEAPKVISLTVPHEIMPVEIKVQYDKLVG
jgi:hypothetical protein